MVEGGIAGILISSLLPTGLPVNQVARIGLRAEYPPPAPACQRHAVRGVSPLPPPPTPVPVLVKSTPALFQGQDAVQGALSYLKQNSDIQS